VSLDVSGSASALPLGANGLTTNRVDIETMASIGQVLERLNTAETALLDLRQEIDELVFLGVFDR
jgi:hypothetical protein